MLAARTIIWASLLSPLWVAGMWSISIPLAVFPAVTCHLIFLASTLIPNCPLFGSVVRRSAAEGMSVWLTIDDGPTEDTAAILDILDEYDAKATFFLIGSKAEEDPDSVRQILRRGHGIGNHTQTHPSAWFWIYTRGAALSQIHRCQDTLEKLIGSDPQKLFRAPVGLINPMVHLAAHTLGFKVIGWSARGFDAVSGNAKTCARRIMRDVRPGAIILLHQGVQSNDRHAGSIACIRETLAALHSHGYTCRLPG